MEYVFFKVLGSCIVMALATYGVGILPLKLQLSRNNVRLASMASMGILVGSALVLVIPEGFKSVFSSMRDTGDDIDRKSMEAGIALMIGYVLMYGLDHILSLPSWKGRYIQSEGDSNSVHIREVMSSVLNTSLTLGLILHAGVDGISLGSSFLKRASSVNITFYVAIIFHKLPTAISITSILLSEGMKPPLIKVHLFLFTLTTPIFSILSYLLFSMSHLNNDGIIGILFLFSGGTFLYAVVHVMMDVMESPSSTVPTSSESDETLTHSSSSSSFEFMISCIGMLVPSLLSLMGD